MLEFALKNLLTRKSKFVITIVAIFISTMIVLFSYNVANQINDGIVETATYCDIVVGPNGSATDLVLSAMFFTGTITDTVEDEVYDMIKETKDVAEIIPIATGDNFNGLKIIGTDARLLKNKEIKDGKIFESDFEIVVGYDAHKKYNLKLGDKIVASHGMSEGAHAHDAMPYTVTAILEKTYTAYDDVLFTTANSVWNVHHDEHVQEESGEAGHDKDSGHDGEYTALLVKTRNPSSALRLIDEINEMPGVLAVNPSATLRKLTDSIDTTTVIVYVLCAVIAVMSFIIIYMINVMIMQDLKKDIVLMRLIGLSRLTISKIILIQSTIVSVLALVLAFIFTRISLVFANTITTSMGIVMNNTRIYNGEYLILLIVFVISLMPTMISLFKIFRRDLGDEK